MPIPLAELIRSLISADRQPAIPGLESALMERVRATQLPTIAGRDQMLTPLLHDPAIRPPTQLELPEVGSPGLDMHGFWNPPDRKQLGNARGLEADLQAIEDAGRTSFDITGQKPKRFLLEPRDLRDNGLQEVPRSYDEREKLFPQDPHLQEAERFSAEPDPLVHQDPTFLLNTPVLQSLREMTTLPRQQDARLGVVGDVIAKRLAASGLPPEEQANAQDLLERFMAKVRTPIEMGEAPGEQAVAESGLPVDKALEILNDVRGRLNPKKRFGIAEDPRDVLPELPGNPSELDAAQGIADKATPDQIQQFTDRSEAAAFARRMRSTRMADRARGAVDILDSASTLESGGNLSDSSAVSKPGYLMDTLRFAQRKGKAQYAKRVTDIRRANDQPVPTGKGLSQYELNSIRHWGLQDEAVNPDAVSDIRPGASEDPFQNVLQGHQRSFLLDMQEAMKQGLTKGKKIGLQSGDGQFIRAVIEDVRQAVPEDAQAIGLRQGIAPPAMKQHLQQLWDRSRPQMEVVFRPAGATRPGLESPAVTEPLLGLGQKAAMESRAGIGVDRPAPELNLKPEFDKLLRDQGYGPALDAPHIPRATPTGAPFIVVHPSGKKARIVYVAGQGNNERAQTIANRLSQQEPQEIIGEANIKKLTRVPSSAQFRNQPRDVTALGQGAKKGTSPFGTTTLGAAPETKVTGLKIGKNQAGTFSYSLDGGTTWKDRVFRTSADARKAGETEFMAGKGAAQKQAMRPEEVTGNEVTASSTSGRGPVSGDRRDMEFQPTSTSKEVDSPEIATDLLRKGVPKGSFYITEHYDEKYPGRTYFNAQKSDVTLAIAKDFGSGGTQLTKRAAGAKFVPVQLEHLGNKQALDRTVAAFNKITSGNKDKGIILNIAGNSGNSLARRGSKVSQAELNAQVLAFVKAISEHPGRDFEIKGIISGGQTGIDEAGAMAGKSLGIPTAVNMPGKYTLRDTPSGMDIWTDRDLQKRRFAGEDVSAIFAQKGREGAQKLKEWKMKNPQGGNR